MTTKKVKGKQPLARLMLLHLALTLVSLLPLRGTSVTASASTVSPRHPTALVRAVDSVGLTVSDMDRSVEFFAKVLSFETVSDAEVAGREYEQLQGVFGLRMRVVRMKLGDEFIELTQYLAPEGRPLPADLRSNDLAFQHIAIITSDMERAYGWLRQNKVRHASTGPQRLPDWNKNASGIRAFYFKDPDGHALEILSFPTGKGAMKWHQKTDRLFLGIDHTAIVVSDTYASLKFYRDLLGLQVIGESENYGEEQERLNNVFGARLKITSLRAEEGPGIEFLEYLAPRDGRPAPPDLKANDLAHWQTKLVTDDARRVTGEIRAAKSSSTDSSVASFAASFVSADVVTFDDRKLGFKKAFMVRDPDGHAMQLIEK